MARRRGRRALPGVDVGSFLQQVAPGGHLQQGHPFTSAFEPVVSDNRYTPHVAPSAASRAAWIQSMPSITPPVAAPRLSPTAGLPTIAALSAAATPRAISPQQAYEEAVLHGKLPDPQSILGAFNDPAQGQQALKLVNDAAAKTLGSKENLREPEDLTNLALILGTGGGSLLARGAFKAAELGGEVALGGEAAGTAASEVNAASRLANVARGVGKAAAWPVRHPVLTAGSPVAAEVPGAIAQGNPSQLLHGFAGSGVLAGALSQAGGGVQGAIPGILGAALSDAIELPAQVLPSTYLSAQAGVKALQGDPEQLNQLREGFQKESALGQLVYGHSLSGALGAAAAHPLYTLLEGAGVKSALGHGINEGLRFAGADSAQRGRLRPDLNIYDQVNEQRGPYSRDFFKRRRQEGQDGGNPWAREPGTHGPADPGAIPASDRQIGAYLRSVTDRQIYGGEQARRGNQRRGEGELVHAGPGGRQNRVASLQLQGLISPDPKQAILDMESMRRDLIGQQPHLRPPELKVNKQLVRDLDKAVKGGPLDTSHLVDTFLALQEPVESGLVAANQLTPEQVAERKASPYAYRHMDARYGLSRENEAALGEIRQQMSDTDIPWEQRKGLIGKLSKIRASAQRLGPDGSPLPLDAIHEHMRANGFDPDRLGYVNQQLAGLEGEPAAPATSYAPPDQYAQIGNKKFTGGATVKGTFDASLDALVNSWKGQRTVVDRLANFSRFFDRIGLKSPDGRAFANSTEARHAIEHPEDFNMQLPEVPGGWVPVRVAPWLGKKELAEAQGDVGRNRAQEGGFPDEQLIDQENGGELMTKTLSEALEPGDGPVILAPKLAVDRMQQHFAKLFPAERAAQALTGAFKGAVLPTSVTWLAGNAIDNLIIRTLGTGITPGDIRAGKAFGKLLEDELSERDATYAIESINSGGIFGTHKRIQPYRDARQFAGTKLAPMANAVHRVLETPGPREVHRAYTAYRDAVFELDSKFIEQTGQWGQLSKAARRELGMTRRQWRVALADGDPAVRDLARGFRNPDTVDRYAKSVERVFGNWGKNGPAERRFLTTWAPFWQWARAATKFALVTLPQDHPVLTGLLAAGEQMTREEREKLGFAFDAAEPLPSYLQGSIPDPLAPGGVARVSNLTTFGSFGNPLQFYGANLTPPIISNLALAGMGLDWKGDQMVKADGSPMSIQEKAAAGFRATFEQYVPFLSTAKGIAEKGPSRLNPIREYSPESVTSQRQPRQDISVPLKSSGSFSSSNPWGESESSSSTNPWDAASPASTSSNPWDQ